MNLNELTIKKAREGLDKGEFTSVDLTNSCLTQIENKDSEINAFISVDTEGAIGAAKQADKIIQSKKAKVLTGIPFCVKDSINTKSVRSTGAAKILDNYIPAFSSTVCEKIIDQGAVLIGKNNCDAFGHGASNENSMYGPVKNPHDTSKVAGGSSGGSAAAVADNMAIFSIAEDTGGSIRQPASFCGIYGLRPSYGRNSRYGVMPMASSLDTIGPMAKSVEDVALLEGEMAGHDKLDATTVKDKVPNYLKEMKRDIKDMVMGIPKEYYENEGLDGEVVDAVLRVINKLEKEGVKIKKVSLPYTKYAIAVYYIIVPSEDSSNLGRLDGIRYGVREDAKDLVSMYSRSRSSGFPEEVKRRIMMGTFALSSGYFDAYYRKAQKVRTLISNDFKKVFEEVDVLLTPTSPYPAFGIGEKVDDIISMYLADIFVSPAAVAGVPALSLPVGVTQTGLPIGAQVIGPRLGESQVFQVGYGIEQLLS